MLSLLEGGKILKHTVLLREGFTLAELAHAVEAEGLARADDVLSVGRDPLFLRMLEIPGASVEGYLFPDSYQFVKGVPPEEMIARMVAKMRVQLTPDILKAAEARGLNAHRLLTLASIIEREGVLTERAAADLRRVLEPAQKVEMPLLKPTRRCSTPSARAARPLDTRRSAGGPPVQHLPAHRASTRPDRQPWAAGHTGRGAPCAPPRDLYFVALDDRRHQFWQRAWPLTTTRWPGIASRSRADASGLRARGSSPCQSRSR